MKKTTTPSDWDLICACLGPNPSCKLYKEVDRSARLICDGLGFLDKSDDSVYDWAHVRDSSDGALTKCAAYIRQHLELNTMVRQALVREANNALKYLRAYR